MIGEVRKGRLQVDRWFANVMSHLTQLERVKLQGHGTPDVDALSGRGITEEILKTL